MLLALVFLLGISPLPGSLAQDVLVAQASDDAAPPGQILVNPAPVQVYYVPLPEDDLLRLFDEDDAAGGTFPDPVSPIRSITSISIGASGTLVYWDQWEDAGYDADMANPGANTYDASTNPDGTQIWGDGVLANGCPPSVNNVPNPCLAPADDQFAYGDVIILDNDVPVASATNVANVLDTFSTVAYNNNNGDQNWASDWTEVGTGENNPATGRILITGNALRFADVDLDDYIWRAVRMPAAGYVPLKFTIGYSGVETTGDTFSVDVSPDGGANWYDAATYGNGSLPGNGSSQEIDISDYAGPDTRVRFYQDNSPDAGEYWYVDDVEVEFGSYYRDSNRIFFDGRDKFGTSVAVAVTRGAFPLSPGSVMAGASEVLDTSRWGTTYEAPLGENTSDLATNAFQDVRWFIMAGAGGATISVDVDGSGAIAPVNYTLAEGAKQQVDGILMGATLSVTTGGAVQVHSMAADVDDTFEFRWDALLPRDVWSNEYYTPVGTQYNTTNYSGCTEVEAYNPNGTTITVNYDLRPTGGTGSFTVPTKTTATGQTTPATPLVTNNNGGRYWSSGGEDFLPISVTDCTRDTSGTDGRLFDWGNPLFPLENLTPEVLVGWAPGCSNESLLGICEDADITTNNFSRSVVWVSPIATTIIYVDTDGSGITCPGGAGADQTINPATALNSYKIDDDPSVANTVRDDFGTASYSNNNGTQNWSTSWSETGDDGSPTAGSIYITGGTLRFRDVGTNQEAGDSIQRQANLSGQIFADLTFQLTSSGNLDADDDLAVDISLDGGATWRTLQVFQDDPTTSTQVKAIIVTPYASANTRIRFRLVDELETGKYWNIDQVQIKYAPDGDYDMTGARILTCDGTKIAAAWGQDPARSGGNDEEALDMGTGIAPFGAIIQMSKSVDRTWVSPGGEVVYTYLVTNPAATAQSVTNVTVPDDKCSPTYYVSGDNGNGALDAGETWTFQCVSHIFVDTVNVAYATGKVGDLTLTTAPDEAFVRVTGAIGDYVWVDEDGDGDQDAGEPGIPNVKLTLTGTAFDGTPITMVTYTDASGGYVFQDVPPGTYTVTVDQNTVPAGLRDNRTYDEDGIATPHSSTVTLGSGEEHMTADFGYNWSTTTETNNPVQGSTGAIGDRVWIDADGQGDQDPEEVGLYNVKVELYTAGPDGLFGTADDVLAATTYTDHNGNYIFDGLPAGAYVVEVNDGVPPAGYAQTGDPDGTLDNKTTDPIVLAPGDVYLNADFGYQPTGASGTIGDTVWLDADRDGIQDAGENGIAQVTVALVKDLNGNGVWDVGEPIIATDITDESGLYSFKGLPLDDGGGDGDADYLVWVNDTANVLNELDPVYDKDGGALPANGGAPIGAASSTVLGLSAASLSAAAPTDNTQDFGYAPPPAATGTGVIGDTIWLDRDGGNDYDPGEGLEGVTVELLDGNGNVIRRTVTDENGNYYFGGLPTTGGVTYTVRVVTSTLPNGGVGLTNTVDPESDANSQSTVTLTDLSPIDLNRDFAYRDTTPNSVGGTLWEDLDADGTQDGSETTIFPGVTVALYEDTNNDGKLDGGDKLVGTTTTDSSGHYSFTGLPDGNYIVDVTDEENLLDGYWHSLGTQGEADDGQSKVDPYVISLSGGENRDTVDFGYYIQPAGLGNYVWNDADYDGIQDVGEAGIPGVVVTLTITWPNGAGTTVLKTVTDANGYYSFDNLLLDEDLDGTGTGEPTYAISVAPPAGWVASPAGMGSDRGADSGLFTGEVVNTTEGSYNDTYDYGFYYYPTGVKLSYFRATMVSDGVTLEWETTEEIDNVGFNLYRARRPLGDMARLNEQMIPTQVLPGSPFGARYTWTDSTARPGIVYFYWLESVDVYGVTALYGPYQSLPATPGISPSTGAP